MGIISVKDLRKHYKDVKAVDGVSFDVQKGEIFGFLGPNGAGKTTTIKMLVTLLRPTGGTATVAGHEIGKEPDKIRRDIGIIFQTPALDDDLTGRENLDFHARMYGLGKKQREEKMKEVLEVVDLKDKADVFVKNYSGGMRRRLEIARGLMHSPRILFLDEPTLGLDPQTRRSIWEYVKTLNKKEGITVFLTTHYMEEAEYLCDRVAIIDFGKIIILDRPSRLKSRIGKGIISMSCSNAGILSSKLRGEKWVESLKMHDSMITVGARDIEKKLPLVLKIAEKSKVKIDSVSIRNPTLEDVFLYYTGRKIRDEKAGLAEQMKNRFRGH